MNSIASCGPADPVPKYCFPSNILVTLFIENPPNTSLRSMALPVWDRAQTSFTRCWASLARWAANESSRFVVRRCSMQILLIRFHCGPSQVHGGESSWPGGKHLVLPEKYLAYGVGIVGGDGVDATESKVDQRPIFVAQRGQVPMRKLAQLKKVANNRPSRWAWRKPSTSLTRILNGLSKVSTLKKRNLHKIEPEVSEKWFHGLVVRTLDSESSNPSSNLGGTCFFLLPLLSIFAVEVVSGSSFCQKFLQDY
ncbi:hypothetical protein TorRG33x02_070480 [Trema orientale]|uniref:Uncharacterized protein n=1 Tax=Trema orientale TaxID=63057 RepID=A0A2P5FHP5_TREOI|nr:hypothetical protein TorRG33x02_070480 [Trema orientale]